MRFPFFRIIPLFALLLGLQWIAVRPVRADLAACFPPAVPVLGAGALKTAQAEIDAATQPAPELQAAARFQKLLLRLAAGEDVTDDLSKLAAENAPAVSECAKAWLARWQMKIITAKLRDHYREHVEFPEKLPPDVPADPWGEGWNYSRTAPKGLGRLKTQRFILEPKHFPKLSTLDDALASAGPAIPKWTLSIEEIGGEKQLRIVSQEGTGAALVKPGAAKDGHTILHFAPGIAIIAGKDRIFALKF